MIYNPPVTFGDSPLEKGAFKGEILVFRITVGVGVPNDPNVGNGLDRSEKIHLLLRFSF